MSRKEYDLPKEILKLYEIKSKKLKETKDFYRKIIENPYRPVGDPVPFDPVLQRYCAMSAYQIENFKPTPKTFLFYLGVIVFPILGLTYALNKDRMTLDEKIRNGLVRYEDRIFRLFY